MGLPQPDLTDDPVFDTLAAGICAMTPAARKGALDEMIAEGLVTLEQAELVLRLALAADGPAS